ncbi:hypothetical protein BH23ACT9_BH23ACT9_34560 [soil metagenome]
METVPAYRYDHFAARHMRTDLRFDPASPAPGDALPILDLETTAGYRITVSSLDRPHLFVFGSRTCPMTVSARDGLHKLHGQFGDAIRFVLVQVREAHPGELIPQPSSFAQKREHATRLKTELEIPFDVAVDDIDGSFHRSLDPKPNAAYLVGTDGVILFRSQWASDVDGLRAALDAVAHGRPLKRTQSRRMVGPMMAALGYVHDVVGRGGPRARRDLLRAAPPMAAAGRLAVLFRRAR